MALSAAGYECTLLAPWAGAEREYPFRCRFFRRRPGLVGRAVAQFMFLKESLSRRWGAIHFHDFDLTLAALFVRLTSWQRVIYDVHENYAEEVMVRGYIPAALRVPLAHVVNGIEWVACRVIRRFVVVVPVQVERFRRWGCPEIVLVRNFAARSFAPADPVEHLSGAAHGYVINIGGQTLNTGAMLLLDAAIKLNGSHPEIEVCGIDRFEGSPGLRDRVVGEMRARAQNYRLLPRVSHHELGGYLRNAVIGLSLRLDTPAQRMGIPTKIFEYMAYGIPIIATDVGYQAEIVRATGSGIIVPHDDPNALADAIADLWSDAELRGRLGRAGRKAFFDSYCWEIEAERLTDYYDGLRAA